MRPSRFIVVVIVSACAWAQQPDWQAAAKNAITAGHLPEAQQITEDRLRASPSDLDALALHARLLAWAGRWADAEREYRTVLQAAPRDSDVLTGLADVLLWQDRAPEALPLLDAALQPGPNADALLRRARILASLQRGPEAARDYRALLLLDPANHEAKTRLAALREFRHQLRFGGASEVLSTGFATGLQSVAWRTRWSDRWATEFTVSAQQRFGFRVGRFAAQLDRQLPRRTWISLLAIQSSSGTVLARRELWGEFGGAFKIANRLLRGMELSCQQRGLWFDGASVAVIGVSQLFYLPRDFTFGLTVRGARSSFRGAGAEWQPSGSVRLGIPLSSRVAGRLSFGVGAENFSAAEQLGHFSAREFGGGIRLRLSRTQELFGSLARQYRSRGVTQTAVEMGYAFRF